MGLVGLVLLALLLTACAASSNAQAQGSAQLPGDMLSRLAEPTFETMGVKQGLPHDSVYGFAQDTRGLLWIATFGGLVRYDGYRMRTYLHVGSDPTSLPDNNVRGLLAGRNGQLWVATGNAAVVSYDPATDSFHPLPKLPAQLTKAHIFAMMEDPDGSLWFGSQLGLAHFHPQQQTYEIYGKSQGAVKGLHQGSVFSVLRDSHGNLWAGGDQGLQVLRAGADHFDTASFSTFEGAPVPPVWTIFEDAESRLWIGTDRNGLGLLDRQSMQVNPVATLSGQGSLIGSATVRGMVETRPNQFWIATYGSGMIVYDALSQTARKYERDTISPSPLANNFIRGVMQDECGSIWIGTDRGLSRLSSLANGLLNLHTSPLRKDGLNGNEVRSVTAQKDRVWVGFDQGGFAVIEPNGAIHSVRAAAGVPVALQSRREVLALKADGDTIFAGGVGLFAIDAHTFTYRPVPSPLLDGQVINALLVERDAVWAATYKGLVRYDRGTRTATLLAHSAGDPASLSDNYVRDLLRTPDGSLWVTTRLGLDWLRPRAGGFLHIRHSSKSLLTMPSDNVQPIRIDGRGRLWIGSIDAGMIVQTGTRRIQEGGETIDAPIFQALGRSAGFPSSTVLTVMVGKDGQIWSNTPRGLAVVDPETLKVRTFTTADGLSTSSQNLFSSATLSDGTIVFPGNQGLIVVRPELLRRVAQPARLVLSEVAVSGRKQSAVAQAFHATSNKMLWLTSKERGLQVTFALLDFADAQDVRYSFRLEGFDPEWSESSADSRTAAYTNLPPGRYRLVIRAFARDSQQPVATTAIGVIVRPAWTQRWWFTLLKACGLIAFVLFAIRFRTAVVERRREALEEVVRQRTQELDTKQAELIDANHRLEKLAMYDQLTGISNRRYFLQQANKERERARRSRRPYAVLLMDVDHFKNINDQFGHAAGDQVLRDLAQALVQELRSTDLIARWGGEELVALLTECDEAVGHTMAERLRARVERMQFRGAPAAIHVSISIGLSSDTGGLTIEEALQSADMALYQAKRAGRNCVVAASELATSGPANSHAGR